LSPKGVKVEKNGIIQEVFTEWPLDFFAAYMALSAFSIKMDTSFYFASLAAPMLSASFNLIFLRSRLSF